MAAASAPALPGAASDPAAEECCICMERMAVNEPAASFLRLKCAHHFHVECFLKWHDESASCPVCRTSVEPVAKRSRTLPDTHLVDLMRAGYGHLIPLRDVTQAWTQLPPSVPQHGPVAATTMPETFLNAYADFLEAELLRRQRERTALAARVGPAVAAAATAPGPFSSAYARFMEAELLRREQQQHTDQAARTPLAMMQRLLAESQLPPPRTARRVTATTTRVRRRSGRV